MNIRLIFLNLLFFALIGFGILLLASGITVIFGAYSTTTFNVLGSCALYDFIYICILAFVYYLIKDTKNQVKKKEGTNHTDEKMDDKKEILFWAKTYFIFLIIHYAIIILV